MWFKRRRQAKQTAESFWAVVEADEELRERYEGQLDPNLAKAVLDRMHRAGVALTLAQAGEYAEAISEGAPFDVEIPVDDHQTGIITTAADDEDLP